tara:strand:- start:1659 stop:1859 length:201 start_codon:yes stop_codon:yes gene_type:complete
VQRPPWEISLLEQTTADFDMQLTEENETRQYRGQEVTSRFLIGVSFTSGGSVITPGGGAEANGFDD